RKRKTFAVYSLRVTFMFTPELNGVGRIGPPGATEKPWRRSIKGVTMFGFRRKRARAGARAALLAGAAVAALGLGGLGATGASAAPGCVGANIVGEGSSLQA